MKEVASVREALPTDAGAEGASTFAQKLAVGHQEIDRIIDEVEQIYNSQPMEWLALEPIGMMVTHLWYEDEDDFQDAIGGTFEDFMRMMPHIQVRSGDSGKPEFKVKKPNPDSPPELMTLTVSDRKDLWRVLFKSPDATCRVPHLEFEIGCTQKRTIDTIYNHITTAIWNLSQHMRQPGVPEEHKANILTTVDELNKCLDVEEPFTLIVDDPTGGSTFRPDDGIKVERLDGEAEAEGEENEFVDVG